MGPGELQTSLGAAYSFREKTRGKTAFLLPSGNLDEHFFLLLGLRWHSEILMRPRTLSILVPLYNEEEFIGPLLDRVLAAPLPDGLDREVIVVDDGSTDGSAEIAESQAMAAPGLIRVLRHGQNQGKGAAIRTAIEAAEGSLC